MTTAKISYPDFRNVLKIRIYIHVKADVQYIFETRVNIQYNNSSFQSECTYLEWKKILAYTNTCMFMFRKILHFERICTTLN